MTAEASTSDSREFSCAPIPRVELRTAEEFGARIATATEPLIASGIVDSWPALQEWTPRYFSNRYRETAIRATVNLPAAGIPYELPPEDHVRTMSFSEFVGLTETCERACYIHQMSVSKIPELREDTAFDRLLPEGTAPGALYFWFGSGGTRSGLHFDRVNNVNVQVYGRKDVFLVSPDQSRLLYPFSDIVEKSRIDPDHPRFDLYPRLRSVRALRSELSPGDVLFLPRRWWHHIRSLEPAININCWYGEQIGLGAIFGAINAGGTRCWAQVIRDFVTCGVLGRETGNRLFSEQPTGLFLYSILSQGIKRRLPG